MKFKLASDHAGKGVKEKAKDILQDLKIEFEDLSPKNTSDDDYPDFAKKVVKSLKKEEFGLLACGTGIGISIAANKHKGIRAALINSPEDAKLARAHNDANILVLGENKNYNSQELKEIIKKFVSTPFEGGRHEKRIKKL